MSFNDILMLVGSICILIVAHYWGFTLGYRFGHKRGIQNGIISSSENIVEIIKELKIPVEDFTVASMEILKRDMMKCGFKHPEAEKVMSLFKNAASETKKN